MFGDQDDEFSPGEQDDQGGDVALGGAGTVGRVRRGEEEDRDEAQQRELQPVLQAGHRNTGYCTTSEKLRRTSPEKVPLETGGHLQRLPDGKERGEGDQDGPETARAENGQEHGEPRQ